jgi:hypothetical protein
LLKGGQEGFVENVVTIVRPLISLKHSLGKSPERGFFFASQEKVFLDFPGLLQPMA